ncbi:hypothetical protein [Rathayibacter soli]|uniref:hypothetical protein n=1 Tax=Rathayibacter soli TaxID=3144168 RepID=UPI0027E5A463|nr:hypothetical protein [Glaciibacter superstes]
MAVTTVRLTADDRTRLPVGRLGVHPSDEFQATVESDGTIILTPVVTIPKRELLVWENADLRTSILTGTAEAAAGLAHPNLALNDALDALGDATGDSDGDDRDGDE